MKKKELRRQVQQVVEQRNMLIEEIAFLRARILDMEVVLGAFLPEEEDVDFSDTNSERENED